MPVQYIYEDRGIRKRFHGFVDGDAFADSTADTSSRSAFDNAEYVIVDFTDISGHRIDDESMELAGLQQNIARKWAKRAIRVAIVAPDQTIQTLMGDFIASRHGEGFETRVFGQMQQARAWLAT